MLNVKHYEICGLKLTIAKTPQQVLTLPGEKAGVRAGSIPIKFDYSFTSGNFPSL